MSIWENDVDRKKINNKVDLFSSYDKMNEFFGKKDSSQLITDELRQTLCLPFDTDSLIFWRGCKFLLAGDTLMPLRINLRDTTLYIGDSLRSISNLSSNYELNRLFPNIWKMRRGGGESWNGYLQLPVSLKRKKNTCAFLIFEEGKVAYLDFVYLPTI